MTVDYIKFSGVSLSWNTCAFFNAIDAEYLSKNQCKHLTLKS